MSTTPHSIAVAVSGGADSLAVLHSLHANLPGTGHSLMAIHGLFGQELLHEFLVACGIRQGAWPDAEHLSMLERLKKTTDTLGIPLHVVDLSRQFFSAVVRPFVAQYAMGLTPNPCALCNKTIKFGTLVDACHSLGASYLATGHYARLENAAPPHPPHFLGLHAHSRNGAEYGQPEHLPRISPEMPVLKPGADKSKDQSYFLALVSRPQLERAIFPLGGSLKSDVFRYLQKHNLAPPQPGESQEICFIPGGRTGTMPGYREFVPFMAEHLGIPLSGPGPICLENGQELGKHRGLWHYTEGQRKGLGIGWKEPLHVLAKNGETNTLLLGPEQSMATGRLLTGPANILVEPCYWPKTVLVKTRYREAPKQASVKVSGTGAAGLSSAAPHSGGFPAPPVEASPFLDVTFLEKEKAVAPGQLVAVYAQEGEELRLLAGGIIARTQ